MYKIKNIVSRLSLFLVFSAIFSIVFSQGIPLESKAAEIGYINDNDYYYIKNVKSGKFLTVQHNNLSPGSYIVQWNFTGANNQKWKIKYTGDSGTYSGNYMFYAYNTNYVISMPDGSGSAGLTARLANCSLTDNKQMFVITDNLTNAAHRFMTKASNCIRGLVVNNASVYNSAYIVQGDTGVQWSDQWLIERVNGDSYVPGVRYASKNYNHRLATYPDFDFYYASDTKYYESTNFVSQCLTAAGKNYYRTGSYSDWWYINKLNHVQNQYFGYDDLTDNWNITTSWYDGEEFNTFWSNHGTVETYSLNLMAVDPYYAGMTYDIGDIIQIKQNSLFDSTILLTTYVVDNSDPGEDTKVAVHVGNDLDDICKLSDVCDRLFSDYAGLYIDVITPN